MNVDERRMPAIRSVEDATRAARVRHRTLERSAASKHGPYRYRHIRRTLSTTGAWLGFDPSGRIWDETA